MRNERIAAVRDVTELLTELELQLDNAVLTRSRLEAALIQARRSANLPLNVGLDGMDKIAGATIALVAARKAVNEAHYDFRRVRDDLRLPVHAYGDTGDTPREFAPSGADRGIPALSIVAA